MKFKYPFKKMLNILTSLDDPIWFKILYTSSNNSEKLGKYVQSGGRGGGGFRAALRNWDTFEKNSSYSDKFESDNPQDLPPRGKGALPKKSNQLRFLRGIDRLLLRFADY